ncbi:MAG: cryptochrome/photolyase family protein [Planctomycetota bacterium]
MAPPASDTLFAVLGNQLFPFAEVKDHRDASFFMAEDLGLCTYVRHHQQKILLFLAAMRAYADELRGHGCGVHYEALDDQSTTELKTPYETKLERFLEGKRFEKLVMFEIEDRFFEKRIRAFAESQGLELEFLQSPMFVTSRAGFAEYLDGASGKPFMARFYQWQRKRLGLLIDDDEAPVGGRWSFDDENRKKLPKTADVPRTDWATPTEHVAAVREMIQDRFADHPGVLPDADAFWLPTTRRQALAWLRSFLEDRFHAFGPYEDALSDRDDVLFHSVLSPMMNLGLITPGEIVERAVAFAGEHGVPLNSLEGFVRQITGWREFIRGVYRHYDDQQAQTNFWNHTRKMKPCWYDATTGLRPLDDAIDKCRRLGWAHHIERLMVLGNLMNLCEIEPARAHRWFMEMFVDSSDWVMGPNVYGMGLMSDGGIFATKPYICGSNYLVKMSDQYKKSEGWCETMDGLYWRFVDRHRDFFAGNARLAVMLGTLDKMDGERRHRIFTKAGQVIADVTED